MHDDIPNNILGPANVKPPQALHQSYSSELDDLFARANEPKLAHQVAVAAGKLGVDFPRRYDVVATSLRCARAGTVDTPDSDHNLVHVVCSWRHVPRHQCQKLVRQFV